MPKKQNVKSTSKLAKGKKTQIKPDNRNNIRLAGQGVIIGFGDIEYITSIKLLKKLLTDNLTTKDGKESHSIQLGRLADDGIEQETGIWITKKGNALYFVPKENEVLVASVDGFLKLLSGDWTYLKMGKFI